MVNARSVNRGSRVTSGLRSGAGRRVAPPCPAVRTWLDAARPPLAASLVMRLPTDHRRACTALVERRHVDLCRQSSALCR
ncbi:putative leader peptide [Streptomyces sp. e14]|uniref:putative leader peptide n=1 Tax=Streptomyces sp. e14 TaxID=645465 RepID=UPI003FCDE233